MESDAVEGLAGLDGDERQAVAAGLWEAWRSGPSGGAVLTGLSGIGKSKGVVAPLLKRAEERGFRTVLVEVPPRPAEPGDEPIDLEAELLEQLRVEMEYAGIVVPAEKQRRRGLFITMLTLFRSGALVVVDEFQRLLGPDGRPVAPFADELVKIVGRAGRGGLWLVSNRSVDPIWTESFHVATLPKPPEADAIRIVLAGIRSGYDADEWFPAERRARTVARLGANPRVLRLLGGLLGMYTLDDLLGPEVEPMTGPDETHLVDAIERDLVVKAMEGLTDDAVRRALDDLSVLDDWAGAELREAMIGRLGDTSELTRELLNRYLLESRPSSSGATPGRAAYQVHPVVRELNLLRHHGNEAAWRSAHRRAGEWYARPLLAKDLSRVDEYRLATALDRSQRHLRKADADDLLVEVRSRVAAYLGRYDGERDVPELAVERDGRIALLGTYLTDVDVPGLSGHLARLLRARGGPGDAVRALDHARRATRGQVESFSWNFWIQLVRQVDGYAAAAEAGREAARHVTHYLHRIYTATGAALAADGRPAEAVAELRKGCRLVPRVDRYRLAQHALFYAAGEEDPALLADVCQWLHGLRGLEPQATLGDILLHQHRGEWAESVELAHRAAKAPRSLVHFHVCEAVGRLALNQPGQARTALNSARDTSSRRMAREGKTWLAALVELCDNRPRPASEKLARYLGTATAPTKPQEIRAALFDIWDHRIATEGEFNPSFHIPILPPAITGQPENVYRPQYGGPVLPQHREAAARVADRIEEGGSGASRVREGGGRAGGGSGGARAEDGRGASRVVGERGGVREVGAAVPELGAGAEVVGGAAGVGAVPGAGDAGVEGVGSVVGSASDEGVVGVSGGGRRGVVLAVGTEWNSAHGGLSTFNRRLCVALATAGVRVFATAPNASEEEKAQAAAVGVELVKPARVRPGAVHEALSRRPELPVGVEPNVVIGHGRVTGHAADSLLDDFPDARRVHFIHMAPDEIEWFKPDRDDDVGTRTEERHQEELDLGARAHRVVAVGPRLYDRYVRDFSSIDTATVVRLDPGFDVDNPADREPPPGKPWSVLLFGRLEDAKLKGLDIAARAVAHAIGDRGPGAARLELKVRGAPENSSALVRDRLLEWAGESAALRPLVRSYSTDAEKLSSDLRTASLVLVPSRAEGFGLTGVEAITAGTPLLVSEESGLGQLLQDVLDQEEWARVVVPVTGDREQDALVWGRAIVGALRDRKAAFADAARLRERLARQLPWAAAAELLIRECEL
ncbi:glycosyltransferase [Saccharothrix obliqua]|uniref:glycosyltransferase n=1 Tax=Saccharothrix obliqua TaxID=2861747 RepID=UPI001C5DF79E|nr:glycosyltransferase [Saccharothrix obliqua]MBW4719704.1 glycosyltransferase [Saccharothrix obliqua]